MIRLPQRLPDPDQLWTNAGKLTTAIFQYFREIDFAIRALIGIVNGTSPMTLPTYTVSTVPSASANPRALIYVSNEAGGAVVAFSDGTNWRRTTDRAVIS